MSGQESDCVVRYHDDGYPAYCVPHAQDAATCSGRFQCGYAEPGQDKCPEWRCDCFIATHPDTPQELHPEAFRVGSPNDKGHGLDCICPGTCAGWVVGNAGLGFNEDGSPRTAGGDAS